MGNTISKNLFLIHNLNVVEKNKPLIGRELNYSNSIYNTPPDELAFATATTSINGKKRKQDYQSFHYQWFFNNKNY